MNVVVHHSKWAAPFPEWVTSTHPGWPCHDGASASVTGRNRRSAANWKSVPLTPMSTCSKALRYSITSSARTSNVAVFQAKYLCSF